MRRIGGSEIGERTTEGKEKEKGERRNGRGQDHKSRCLVKD